MMGQFYVYILESLQDQSFYIGYSQNPEQRLIKHNTSKRGYTAHKKPWKIVCLLDFDMKAAALHFEKYLKAMKSRTFLERLINSEQNILHKKEGEDNLA